MSLALKELLVILLIAGTVFRLARPIALRFSTEGDFRRRRNVWLVITVAAFLCPNFWLYALVAVPALIWIGRKDSNPGAVYLQLLQIIPSISITVPMVGISRLFDIDNYFLLAFFVMLPAAIRLRRSKERLGIRSLELMDVLLVAYGILTAFLYLRPEISRGAISPFTFTDALRRMFLFFVTIYIPYFVLSRSATDRNKILECMTAFCLSCALMAAIAIFENLRHWLLYEELAARWGEAAGFSDFYTRGDAVRAMASSGHPLTLGYLLTIGAGFWLTLKVQVSSRPYRWGTTLLLWLGLLATYSRGPWIGAAFIYLVFYALRPRALTGLIRAIGAAFVIGIVISFLPIGQKVADMLPFLGGSVGSDSVVYRHRLLSRAWDIIGDNPILGDQEALLRMQGLRQGEGIIDVVNAYVDVLLANGAVGLALFIGFILAALAKAVKASRRLVSMDPEMGMLGASLAACILGTLLMMANNGFGPGLKQMYYALAGLSVAYANLYRVRKSNRRDAPYAAAEAN